MMLNSVKLDKLLSVKSVKRLSVKHLNSVKQWRLEQLLSAKERGGNGVGVVFGFAPCAYMREKHRQREKRLAGVRPAPAPVTLLCCNLTDTFILWCVSAVCASGRLHDAISTPRYQSPLLSFLHTPTPENFGTRLYMAPHRPDSIFDNRKELKQNLKSLMKGIAV